MRPIDLMHFTLLALRRQRFRSLMLLLSVGIGVASVVILVSLGEGARRYVLSEFSFIGKDVLVMLPGKTSTAGGMPPATGVAARDITLDQVAVLARTVAGIDAVAPLVIGNAPVSFGDRSRDSVVMGTTATFVVVRQLHIAQGSNLPDLELGEGSPVAIIGKKLKHELFDNRRAIGQWIRLRGYRFRVIGILEGRGDSFGLDLSEAIFIPVASAQSVFNVNGLFRVIVSLREGTSVSALKINLAKRMQELHEGEADVTLISPDAMIQSFGGVLRVLTLGVGGIAAISLIVAGILVMNLTLMSVKQRTSEIGLLKAIGAPSAQIRSIFLAEAGTLATTGSVIGLAGALLLIQLCGELFPAIPFHTPLWALASAASLAIGTALAFAWFPATQAARLEPVLALGKR